MTQLLGLPQVGLIERDGHYSRSAGEPLRDAQRGRARFAARLADVAGAFAAQKKAGLKRSGTEVPIGTENRVISRKSDMKLALIALCLILVGCSRASHDESPTAAAHYQLVVDSGGNAWRLDTNTGEMKRCWQGTPPGVKAPTCYTATQE